MNESALKERLKIIAAEKETILNKVWKQLLLERFLARLSNSPYQDKFIFKGGLLLAQYIAIKRETVDINFLMTKIKSEKQNIEKAMNLQSLLSDSINSRRLIKSPHYGIYPKQNSCLYFERQYQQTTLIYLGLQNNGRTHTHLSHYPH